MITIRNYTDADYGEAKAILQSADMFEKTWDARANLQGMITKDPESILVAVEDNTVVAHMYIVSFGSKVAHFYRLAVKEGYRKKGVATQLLKKAEELVKKRGVVMVGLFVTAKNDGLRTFYKKRNFQTSGKEFVHMWKMLG